MGYPCKTLVEYGLFLVSKLGCLLVLSRRYAPDDRMGAACFGCGYIPGTEDYLRSLTSGLDKFLVGQVKVLSPKVGMMFFVRIMQTFPNFPYRLRDDAL